MHVSREQQAVQLRADKAAWAEAQCGRYGPLYPALAATHCSAAIPPVLITACKEPRKHQVCYRHALVRESSGSNARTMRAFCSHPLHTVQRFERARADELVNWHSYALERQLPSNLGSPVATSAPHVGSSLNYIIGCLIGCQSASCFVIPLVPVQDRLQHARPHQQRLPPKHL